MARDRGAYDLEKHSPLDRNGAPLSVYDIVILHEIPEYYLEDCEDEDLRNAYLSFKGCYGLIKYSIWPDHDGVRRWYGQNDLIIVEAIKLEQTHIKNFDFTIAPDMVERIPYNILIMNLFVNYDWQMEDMEERTQDWSLDLQRRTKYPISEGTKQYEMIKSILNTPYPRLVAMHDTIAASMAR